MLRLSGVVQPYAWGSTTAIPKLLGRDPDGSPEAELWLGAHPKAPSSVDGRSLLDLVSADPAGMLGQSAYGRFGPQLPFLLKLLAADRPLSLQAHPDRDRAERGFAEGVYADDWPKPEMLVALTGAEALCGFREPSRTHALFAQLGVRDALELVEPLAEGGPNELAEVFGRILRLTEADHGLVAQVVAAAAETEPDDPELADVVRTALELDEHFPGDQGILAALLLNRIRLAADEAVFLPAGNLHAYLRGFGVEVMANSDNVIRGGLTSKEVAVEELLTILDFTPGLPPLVQTVEESPGVWRYVTPAPEFALWRIAVDGPREVPGAGSGRVLLVTDGEVAVVGSTQLRLNRGEAAFAQPGDELSVTGRSGTVFVAGPGV